jgi:RNA polymerase sigma factor (sigma-70 family)
MSSSVDEHFRYFAKHLEEQIAKYSHDQDEDLLKRQKRQVENLINLERKFRIELVKHPWGTSVYEAFMTRITAPKEVGGYGNRLASRPFFRERQEACIGPICEAIEKRDVKKLQRFHVNSLFVQFAMKQKKWPAGSKVRKLAQQIQKQRDELVISNMPLAISQARLFWGKAARMDPNQALSYMDFVQLGSEGLMSAIDKYVLPFSATFRATIVQWCVGNFIEANSATMVHFYPKDKKKLYHANKHVKRLSPDDAEDDRLQKLADKINAGVKASHRTNAQEVGQLMAAATAVSADATVPGEEKGGRQQASFGSYVDRASTDPDHQPDNRVQDHEAHGRLHEAIQLLTPWERKVLRLRGVSC